MDEKLKNRLVGAAVVLVLGAIAMPFYLSSTQQGQYNSKVRYRVPLLTEQSRQQSDYSAQTETVNLRSRPTQYNNAQIQQEAPSTPINRAADNNAQNPSFNENYLEDTPATTAAPAPKPQKNLSTVSKVTPAIAQLPSAKVAVRTRIDAPAPHQLRASHVAPASAPLKRVPHKVTPKTVAVHKKIKPKPVANTIAKAPSHSRAKPSVTPALTTAQMSKPHSYTGQLHPTPKPRAFHRLTAKKSVNTHRAQRVSRSEKLSAEDMFFTDMEEHHQPAKPTATLTKSNKPPVAQAKSLGTVSNTSKHSHTVRNKPPISDASNFITLEGSYDSAPQSEHHARPLLVKKPTGNETGSENWVAQIGSFSSYSNALHIAERLQAARFPAYTDIYTSASGKKFTRVLVGTNLTHSAAMNLVEQIKARLNMAAIVRHDIRSRETG